MTGIGFDKIFVFCDKFYICNDKCVSIVIKIKWVNFDNISDICDKFNFTTNYTYYIITNTYLSKYTQQL